jgi:hypothetical protein
MRYFSRAIPIRKIHYEKILKILKFCQKNCVSLSNNSRFHFPASQDLLVFGRPGETQEFFGLVFR